MTDDEGGGRVSRNNDDDEGIAARSRRDFLKLGAGCGVSLVAAAGALGAAVPRTAAADDIGPLDIDPSVDPELGASRRAGAAYNLREFAARQHLDKTMRLDVQYDNDDETRYADRNYYASFTKTLPHNLFGEVDPAAFEQLQAAMRSGAKEDFDAIPADPLGGLKLANPQGAFKYELAGLDSHATRIARPHTFRSAELAGELAEVYWQALTRDVPYAEYGSDPLIAAAVDDLNRLSAKPGPLIGGQVTPATLFRGLTPGDLEGPYISQFLLQRYRFGALDVIQRYPEPRLRDYMTRVGRWLNVQRGGLPEEREHFERPGRYINDNRMLATYVHVDKPFQAYLNAALILLEYGDGAFDPGNPYRSSYNQSGFTSLGEPFVLDLVCKAANLGLTGAWFHKWRVNRFLRPEALGGRVHFHLTGQRDYELHPDILASQALQEAYTRHGTYLLPQAYPEGSPTHPSFPAGHACIAGACVTVLKAFFDENLYFEDPVVPDAAGQRLLPYEGQALNVGNELNKLANNIALGRDAAGVHLRQDGVQGLRCGEQQAIALLQDQSRTLNEEDFGGFTLTRFDGQRINIRDGEVSPA
jgi:hypothetical protein